MNSRRRIRTVLYGDQVVEGTELDLLHTPALQRLYDLHQLGLTDRVFIDASHSRLHHVIGVLAQVDRITNAIASNLESGKSRLLEYRAADGKRQQLSSAELHNYVRRRRKAVRLMGLLHDLTHAPFGHTLEDEIELIEEKHDYPQRQAVAFYRLLVQYISWLAFEANMIDGKPSEVPRRQKNQDEEMLLRVLETPALASAPDDQRFIDYVAGLASQFLGETHKSRFMVRAPSATEMVQLFHDLRFAMRGLLWLDALHKDNLDQLCRPISKDEIAQLPEKKRAQLLLDDGSYPFERLIDKALELSGESPIAETDRFHLQRDAFFLDIIGNTICADLLDYAKRDSHFAGLKLDYDSDRIVENFTLVSYRRPRDLRNLAKRDYRQKVDPILRTGISIFSHKLRLDVPGELMNLLQVRFYVYQRVLFHPTKCVAGAMLGSALKLIGWNKLPVHFRFVGDAVFLGDVAEIAKTLRTLIQQHDSKAKRKPSLRDLKLAKILEPLPESSVILGLRQLLDDRGDDEADVVREDLHAAIRLLDRLTARRYHRPIFRLLPNAEIPLLNFHAEQIAPVFQDPNQRAVAERKIEELAALPRGTVTIHCPNAQGPRKIAEILILSEKDDVEMAYPLREIGSVDHEIFDKHQNAITALEEMYRSMWRLMVSVAPPYHEEYERINPIIGRVLYAVLSGEEYEDLYPRRSEYDGFPAVPNDSRQVDELVAASAAENSESGPTIQLIYPDGRTGTRSQWFLNVADDAVSILKDRVVEVEGYLQHGRFAAQSKNEQSIRDVLDRVILSHNGAERPVPDPKEDPADIPPGLFDGDGDKAGEDG